MLLKLEPDINVIAVAEDGAVALEAVAKENPDLVLMDLKMPILNGVEATRQIRLKYPNVKVLVLTTYDGDDWVFDAIKAGASGYLLKDTPRDELIKAVRGTVGGGTYLHPSIAGKVIEQVNSRQTQPSKLITGKLTDREVEVLTLMTRGLSNNDMAEKLFLSEGTVRNHVSAILSKLGVADRTQAVVLAIQHGLGGKSS
jgi:DNA-binding NarL/FixJ family response regulator